MESMKNVLVNKLGEKFSEGLGEISIKLSEKAVGKCIMSGFYEPKLPIELLARNK
ncbi:cyclic lactone autoinducer peptide [Inconstantimicrobium mannanitabidum]|uniref:Uncharacterized protein n=1 Tax=Inconstantimicrobium mannanitabidum TaxID=1604901 RepID=A0ACB5RIK0_9CLOT|nr:cyclic lactone autoinducer peptide [Clostridium sp. TW13]GKX68951.1 hypothetical protein rsdtw13_42090 [Clostridium sp. TW13]